MSEVIRWEQPPAHGNTGREKPRFTRLAAELRARPGEWAVIAEDITSGYGGALSSRVRGGKGSWAPRGAFESRTVGPAGGKATVYARYIGEENR